MRWIYSLVLLCLAVAGVVAAVSFSNRYEVVAGQDLGRAVFLKIDKITGKTWMLLEITDTSTGRKVDTWRPLHDDISDAWKALKSSGPWNKYQK